jgi:hypothetical protein
MAKLKEDQLSSSYAPYDQRLSVDSPALYRISVQGRVDSSWSDFLDNVSIRASRLAGPSTVTTLTAYLVDQSTLAGVLQYIYLLGLPLLKIECLEMGSKAPSDMVSS